MILKIGLQHWVLKYYQLPSNEDPRLTFVPLMKRSTLVPYVARTAPFRKIEKMIDFHIFCISTGWVREIHWC